MSDFARARVELDGPEGFVRLRRELGVSSFGLNQINFDPKRRGRIHRHERQEEVYLVISGELTIEIEGAEPQVLGAGELLRVGPHTKRQLSNRSSERVVLVAIGAYGEHEGRDGEAFTEWGQEVGAPPQEVPLPENLP
jgi:mannose-6-phosphate isomerase-like protein (cupin superfamily)